MQLKAEHIFLLALEGLLLLIPIEIHVKGPKKICFDMISFEKTPIYSPLLLGGQFFWGLLHFGPAAVGKVLDHPVYLHSFLW